MTRRFDLEEEKDGRQVLSIDTVASLDRNRPPCGPDHLNPKIATSELRQGGSLCPVGWPLLPRKADKNFASECCRTLMVRTLTD